MASARIGQTERLIFDSRSISNERSSKVLDQVDQVLELELDLNHHSADRGFSGRRSWASMDAAAASQAAASIQPRRDGRRRCPDMARACPRLARDPPLRGVRSVLRARARAHAHTRGGCRGRESREQRRVSCLRVQPPPARAPRRKALTSMEADVYHVVPTASARAANAKPVLRRQPLGSGYHPPDGDQTGRKEKESAGEAAKKTKRRRMGGMRAAVMR